MNLLKAGLLLIGGYLVLRFMQQQQQPPSEPATGPVPAGPGAAPSDIKSLVAQVAAAANPEVRPLLLDSDQWAYYFRELRGTEPPAWEAIFPGATDRQKRLTIDEWWAAASQAGLSGLPSGAWVC